MKPVYFDQANVMLETPKELSHVTHNLPAHRNAASQVVTLWKANLWTRLKFLFQNKMWMVAYSGDNMPPVRLKVAKKVIGTSLKFAVSAPAPNRRKRKKLEKLKKV